MQKMDGNTYANEDLGLVRKLTTALIYYFLKTADGKLLMIVKQTEMLEKNRRREEELDLEAELCSLSGKPTVKERLQGDLIAALLYTNTAYRKAETLH